MAQIGENGDFHPALSAFVSPFAQDGDLFEKVKGDLDAVVSRRAAGVGLIHEAACHDTNRSAAGNSDQEPIETIP